MKTKPASSRTSVLALLIPLGITIAASSCKKNNSTDPPSNANYAQTTLTADTAGYGAVVTDTNLNNAWGIAIGPNGDFWVCANHSGSIIVYNTTGNEWRTPVGVPFGGDVNGASPTGIVRNTTGSFMVNGTAATFIVVTEDGIVAATNGGDTTVTVADRSGQDAIYKGVTIASDGGTNYIYATDFHNGKIDVFDQSFNYVNKSFTDANIPAGFAPFNIQNINGQLYVTYARQKGPDNEDDQSGAGNGYVDIYKPDGSLVKRFASQGTLNSPWAITLAPPSFGRGNNSILIGNFGDGRINVYDANGNYSGQLESNKGNPITIDGLWALIFPQSSAGGLDPNKLYFSAGPQEEEFGLFGFLQKK
jgi:uncharacterized protein (TIGR03118 family)